MGIRRRGTTAQEKQSDMTRAAGVAKRARARIARHKRWVKEYGSVGVGSVATKSTEYKVPKKAKKAKKRKK